MQPVPGQQKVFCAAHPVTHGCRSVAGMNWLTRDVVSRRVGLRLTDMATPRGSEPISCAMSPMPNNRRWLAAFVSRIDVVDDTQEMVNGRIPSLIPDRLARIQ